MTEVSIATLRRCHIQFHRPMVVDILPSLESFMESGLDVSLAYSPLHTTTGFSPWQGLADAPGPPFW
ncbi:hypothetical protein B0H19DRAFT_1117157 [Mycena capillaripes]|nr:hypothetical protein B0H19DRAFT_1117157 [Mycena capillaripes]